LNQTDNNSSFNIRQIIYIVLMTALFLGMNYFFSYQQDQKNREFLAKKKELLAKDQAEREREYGNRAAALKDFPLVELKQEQEGKTLQLGVKTQGGVATIAWSSKLPKTLYADNKTLTLLTPDSVIGGAAFYGPESFSELETPWLTTENQELQLLAYPIGKTPEVIYGEFREGTVVPLSALPGGNALVLVNKEGNWNVAGFYSFREKSYSPLSLLPNFQLITKTPEASSVSSAEESYVLENDFVQLVFSNRGGAISEINLPFQSEKNQVSVVNPIEIDRQILEDAPKNGLFPLNHYFLAADTSIAREPKRGGYYPLLRRQLIAPGMPAVAPEFYACNLVSNYPDLPQLMYSVVEFSSDHIVFEARQPNRKIRKTYTLPATKEAIPYLFNFDIQIEGDARGLYLTSGVPEVELISGAASPIVEYRLLRNGVGEVEKVTLPKSGETLAMSSSKPQWLLNSNGYLGTIQNGGKTNLPGFKVISINGEEIPTRLALIDPKYNTYPASKFPGYSALVPLPNQSGTSSYQIYCGPFEEKTLKTVDRMIMEKGGVNPDFRSAKTFHGWFSFISRPFARLLFSVMSLFHTLTGSWGFSIILLTVFLRIVLYPLSAWSYKSMKKMQLLSPQTKAIQKKYKNDSKKAQAELMELYRKHNVNPFMGCFPILIQFPFLIAMFDLLKSSFQLRGASFIPGWIDNLTAPDVLFSWSTPIFFFGTQFHLLPVILGGVMFLQQRVMSPLPKDQSEWTDQQRQQRSMGTMMAVVFFVMFYSFPSGLNLYWLFSMIFGMGQQWITNRYVGKTMILDNGKEK
jgi:YidC/Oxa1 family membrane protein insertase